MIYDWNAISFFDVIISTLASVGITSAIFRLAGKRWLSGVEAKYARELEELRAKYSIELEHYKNELANSKQLLQAEIDKTFLVTKVHFETEFQALKDVFALLADIRLRLPNLRPKMRIARSGETREDREKELDKATSELEEVYNKLVAVSENTSPFYPREISAHVSACEEVIRRELSDISLTARADAFRLEWLNRGDRNLNEFLVSYGKVSELIRERIARMAILRTT
jgi:hypothetical protein